ncbi:hypothetical protein ACS0TY_017545 [Phlomoides rotata]
MYIKLFKSGPISTLTLFFPASTLFSQPSSPIATPPRPGVTSTQRRHLRVSQPQQRHPPRQNAKCHLTRRAAELHRRSPFATTASPHQQISAGM